MRVTYVRLMFSKDYDWWYISFSEQLNNQAYEQARRFSHIMN